jgi:hypothetical protein
MRERERERESDRQILTTEGARHRLSMTPLMIMTTLTKSGVYDPLRTLRRGSAQFDY